MVPSRPNLLILSWTEKNPYGMSNFSKGIDDVTIHVFDYIKTGEVSPVPDLNH